MVKFDKNPYSGQRMTEKDHLCGQLTTSNLAFALKTPKIRTNTSLREGQRSTDETNNEAIKYSKVFILFSKVTIIWERALNFRS